MRQLLFIILILIGTFGCTNPAETTSALSYFDLKGFIDQQIVELNKRKPLVSKQMTVGADKEVVNSTHIDWAKELELFLKADLNKQAYQLSYNVSQPTASTYVYTLKQGENLPVKLLKITLDGVSRKPSSVEATLKEENQLFESEKKLLLTCAMRPEGIWLIKTYEISGFQHLALTDKKTFSVKGEIK